MMILSVLINSFGQSESIKQEALLLMRVKMVELPSTISGLNHRGQLKKTK
jgi:hypothetical protein